MSDYNEVLASNQFALPVLQCLMWTQVKTIVDLLQLDVEVSKVITQSGGKHSLGSTELMYLPNKLEERDLKSVEELTRSRRQLRTRASRPRNAGG